MRSNGKTRKAGVGLDVQHPLIRHIARMTAEATGVELLIVYPELSGWGQAYGDGQLQPQPDFCKLIKSTQDGAKYCRMCHVLMAVAACNGSPTEQRCHAGASVLACPANDETDEAVAVISSCTFAPEEAWSDTRKRGEKLGINLALLRKAFLSLPLLSPHQRGLLEHGMRVMSHAIRVIRHNQELMARNVKDLPGPSGKIALEGYFQETAWVKPDAAPASGVGEMPLLVNVVCELVRQRSDLPLTVKELAEAARLTPNHFTTLFREHAGVTFTEYLMQHRIDRAFKLLRNPTLSISEVARLVGYDDPGYFARRFHQRTKLTPREWRNRHGGLGHSE